MSISFIWYQLFWIGALDEAYMTSWKSGLNFNAHDLLITVLSNKAVLCWTYPAAAWRSSVEWRFCKCKCLVTRKLRFVRLKFIAKPHNLTIRVVLKNSRIFSGTCPFCGHYSCMFLYVWHPFYFTKKAKICLKSNSSKIEATDQDSRSETLLWGRNIVLIWGITKPFQQNEVPCYACKEFRALKANVYFRVAYSLNIEQGTSFSGRIWWYLKSKLCCGPKVTFPIYTPDLWAKGKAKLSPEEQAEVSLSLPNWLFPCRKPVKIMYKFINWN